MHYREYLKKARENLAYRASRTVGQSLWDGLNDLFAWPDETPAIQSRPRKSAEEALADARREVRQMAKDALDDTRRDLNGAFKSYFDRDRE